MSLSCVADEVSRAMVSECEYASISQYAPSPQVFPQELFDQVIDHLHDDKDALRQCSLVSRNWLPSSSFHLFERVSYPPCHHAWDETFRHETCNCSKVDAVSFWKILRHLVKNTPRVRQNVQRLRVCCTWIVGMEHISSESTTHQAQISPEDLYTVLDLLPCIREFYLCDLILRDHPGEHSRQDRTRLKALDSLTLSNFNLSICSPLQRSRVLCHILDMFSHINDLVVSGIWSNSSNEPNGLEVAQPSNVSSYHRPAIHNLRFVDSPIGPMKALRTLQSLMDPTSLSGIDIHSEHCWGPNNEEDLNDFLHSFLCWARNVTMLSLNIQANVDLLIHSSVCPNLRELRLRSWLKTWFVHLNEGSGSGDRDDDYNPGNNWLGTYITNWSSALHILDHARVPTLERVRIELVIRGRPQFLKLQPGITMHQVQTALTFVDWTLLDAIAGKFRSVELHLQVDTRSMPASLVEQTLVLLAETANSKISIGARREITLKISTRSEG